MKAHKKQERANKKLAEILAKRGYDTQTLDLDDHAPTESISQQSLEGEAVLAYWERGREFREKDCTQCGKRFATNYNSVANCSDKCRRDALAAIGITWSPVKTQHERWGRTPPLVVPQEALILLAEIRQQQNEPQPNGNVLIESDHQLELDVHTLPDF